MKRAIVIHCWGGNPDYAWYPWVKAQLENQGYQVTVPAMPDPGAPRLDKWLRKLQQTIGRPDDELILIGHSIGTVTIMRYLETLSDDEQVGKVIFVAGYTDQIGFKELENFFESHLNFDKIKTKSIHGFVAIQSDNDPYVSEQYGNRLKDELGAKLIIKPGAKHMSGELDGEEPYLELPDILTVIADK